MEFVTRLLRWVGIVALLSATAFGQSETASPPAGAGAQISGTVNVDGKPASGIPLLLVTSGDTTRPAAVAFSLGGVGDRTVKARAVTDSQGHYTFQGIQAAPYVVFPFSPILAPPPVVGGITAAGQVLNVKEDETVDGVDFSLSRGGIITGKVTRSDGQPAIQVSLSLTMDNQKGPSIDTATGRFSREIVTDDRGFYRAYGLNPGRYTVCTYPSQSSGYALNATFCYGSSADRAHSKLVEVAGGDEISNIDISIGPASVGYAASGRISDDDGNPVPGVNCYFYGQSDDGRMDGGKRYGALTDQNGEFQIHGLVPGHYGVSAQLDGSSGGYSDPVPFQISDSDLSNILVTVHTGSSISGIVTVEGTQDPGVLSQLPNVQLQMYSQTPGQSVFAMPVMVNPAPDGAFQASGISPGQLRISMNRLSSPPNFSVIRVEQNGAPQPNGITATAGQPVTGVQVILSYGTGSIRGIVAVPKGSLPSGSQMVISAQGIGDASPGPSKSVIADARGRFEIGGLPDAQYQMSVSLRTGSGVQSQKEQVVTVSGGQPTDVALTVPVGKQN
jgi:hypothetical protein